MSRRYKDGFAHIVQDRVYVNPALVSLASLTTLIQVLY